MLVGREPSIEPCQQQDPKNGLEFINIVKIFPYKILEQLFHSKKPEPTLLFRCGHNSIQHQREFMKCSILASHSHLPLYEPLQFPVYREKHLLVPKWAWTDQNELEEVQNTAFSLFLQKLSSSWHPISKQCPSTLNCEVALVYSINWVSNCDSSSPPHDKLLSL